MDLCGIRTLKADNCVYLSKARPSPQGSTLLSGRLSQFWSAHWWAFNRTLLLCRTIRNKWSLQIVCLGTERKKYKIHLLTQTALAKYYCSLVCKRTSSPVLPKTSWRWQDAVTVLGIYNKKTSFFLDIGNLANDFVSLCLLSARRQVGLIDGSDAPDCCSLFILIWTFREPVPWTPNQR